MDKVILWTVALALAVGSFFANLTIYIKVWALVAIPMGAKAIDFKESYGIATLVIMPLVPSLMRYVEDEKGEAYERVMKVSIGSALASLVSWGIISLIF